MRRAVAVRVVGPLQWVVYPALVAVILTVLMATPLRVFGLTLPEPVFPMVLAFAWPMIRPSMLAALMMFALGIFLDLFWGGPIGLWPLCFMTVFGMMLAVRVFLSGLTTVMNFGLYAASILLAFFVAYLVTALRLGNAPSIIALIGQIIPTLLLFPVADWLMQTFDDNDVRFL